MRVRLTPTVIHRETPPPDLPSSTTPSCQRRPPVRRSRTRRSGRGSRRPVLGRPCWTTPPRRWPPSSMEPRPVIRAAGPGRATHRRRSSTTSFLATKGSNNVFEYIWFITLYWKINNRQFTPLEITNNISIALFSQGPNSTWLVTSQLDTFDVSSESRRACRAVLFQHGGQRTSYSARLYKFNRFYALTYTNFICSVKWNIGLLNKSIL